MKKVLLFTLVILCQLSIAQPVAVLQWAVTMSGAGNSPSYVNEVTSISIDPNNYIVIGGNVAGTIDLDPSGATLNVSSANTTHFSGFFACYDTLHDLQWGKILYSTENCNIRKIGTDNLRRVYVAGEYINDMDADPDPGNTVLLNAMAGGRDIFISKYTPAGNYMWSVSIGGIASLDIVNDMIVDGSGNVYITGTISDTTYFDSTMTQVLVGTAGGSMFIAKYSPAGTFLWANLIDESPTQQEGQSLTFDNMLNPVAGMKYSGTVDVDPSAATVNYTAQGSRDYLIIKFNHNGGYLSSFSLGGGTGGPMIDEGYIAYNSNNDIAVTAQFYGTLDIDPSATVNNIVASSSGSIFTAVFSEAGGFQWVKTVGSGSVTAYAYDIVTDSSGGVYVDAGFNSNGAVYKYDSLGTLEYIKPIGGSNIYNKAINVEKENVIVTGGGFRPNAIFDSTVVSGGSGYTAYLARYAECLPAFVQSQSSSQSVCAGDNIQINVTAVGSDIHYQWYKNNVVLAADTSGQIDIINADSSDSGNYYCVVSGACGSDTSSIITIAINFLPVSTISYSAGQLTVNPPAAFYTWYLNNLPTGQTTQSISPTQQGLYFAIVTDANGCSDTSNIVTFTDIDNPGNISFTIYPIPSNGLVYIKSGNAVINQLELYDMTGRLVASPLLNDDNSAFIGNQKGIFLLKIKSLNREYYIKVIVQ